uniref:SFRICE014660.1 n=1 Tax=Spodoptera frugiperda TaxID=7108 RepID=A0A2H1V232_SPOFR
MMNNVTIKVGTLFKCESIQEHLDYTEKHFIYDPIWRQTAIGCTILCLLQNMYKFNFGFLLSRRDQKFFTTFYSKPFARPVWNCLYAMAFLTSIIFYMLKRWEFSVVGGWHCSFVYESLVIIGGYCQHIPPIDTRLPSRRIAYFIFFVFTYIVYTFYTSNLLSNLVNDTDNEINLETLVATEYMRVIVDYMMRSIVERSHMYVQNYGAIFDRLMAMRVVTVIKGLEEVKTGRVALLSDYTTIYPNMKRAYDNDDICKLVSVDIFSGIKKYFRASKDFAYKEQFKIGTLRIKESGILQRIVSTEFEEPKCTKSHLIQISMQQISIPITILACSYVISFLILVVERIHYKRYAVWPYVE